MATSVSESVDSLLFLTGSILHIEILVMGWRPVINSTTKWINDRSYGHDHDLEVIGRCGDEDNYNGHGGLAEARGGVVVAAPPAVEVAAIIVMDSSGRVVVAIQ